MSVDEGDEAKIEEVSIPVIVTKENTANDFDYDNELLKEQYLSYKQDRRHRKGWSWYIAVLMGLTFIFEVILFIGVGRGWLNFEKYIAFLNTGSIELLLQIVGLGYIVSHYLFPSGTKVKKLQTKESAD